MYVRVQPAVHITSLRLKNFRCFTEQSFSFDKPFVLIEGDNGSGKTSLLEALHYACYLRSFRTRRGRELITFNHDHFFVEVGLDHQHDGERVLQVGFTGDEKVVKFNKKPVSSYKELTSYYRIIAASEDDLDLIKGNPDERRAFIDQCIILEYPEKASLLRAYRKVLSSRNALIARNMRSDDELEAWTRQLWQITRDIQQVRGDMLSRLEKYVRVLVDTYFASQGFDVSLAYRAKNGSDVESFELFWKQYQKKLLALEQRYGRSLFGVHLDDFAIDLRFRKAKHFASRGQQKLVVFLIKVAQFHMLKEEGKGALMVFDDFLTDLDRGIFATCLSILEGLDCQIFLTCPLKSFIPEGALTRDKLQVITF